LIDFVFYAHVEVHGDFSSCCFSAHYYQQQKEVCTDAWCLALKGPDVFFSHFPCISAGHLNSVDPWQGKHQS